MFLFIWALGVLFGVFFFGFGLGAFFGRLCYSGHANKHQMGPIVHE